MIHERAGYWKEINGTRIHCFNAEGLQRASSGFGQRKVVEVLEAAGALVDRDSGKHTKAIWIPELERAVRCYMVNPERLELSL